MKIIPFGLAVVYPILSTSYFLRSDFIVPKNIKRFISPKYKTQGDNETGVGFVKIHREFS